MKLIGLNREKVRTVIKHGEVTIAVYGMGKMGLPLAAVFADHGAKVIGVDINERVVEMINRGENHVKEEPGLDELVRRNVEAGRLRATTDGVWAAKQADVMVILVPTLTDGRGNMKLDPVYDVAEKISQGLEKGDIVITEATMPPGTTESLIPILEKSGLKLGEFGLAHAPERTMTGTAIRDITGQYPKIVGASDEKTLEALIGIYETINRKGVIPMSSIKAAEAVKVFEGVYRDVNIALANELAMWCEEHGLDALEVFKAANTQPYCHLHMPGAGVGGHCFAKDEFVFLDKNGLEPLTVEELFGLIEGQVEEIEGVMVKRPEREYRILSFDPVSKRPTLERVTLATKRRLKPGERVLEIKTRTGRSIKLTENHIVWVYKDGSFIEKLAKDVRAGDRIAILTELPQKETPRVLDVISILSENPDGYRVKFAGMPKEVRALLHSKLAPNGDGSVSVYEGKHRMKKNGKEYITERISASVEVATASDKLAQQLFLMLQNLGVVPSYKRNGNVHILRIFGPDNLEKLREILSGEKGKKLDYYLSNIKKREKNSSFELMGSFALVEVKEVGAVEYDDYVYSFEVEGTNTIVTTSGIIVHNCIPVYPWFVINLAKKTNPRLVKTAREINDSMPHHVVELTIKGLNEAGRPLKGSNILVFGLTFRGGVREFMKAAAKPIIKELKEWGANVYAYDPLCTPEDAERFGAEWKEDFKDVDAVVITADHREFRELDLEKLAGEMRSKVIVDGRNVLKPEEAQKHGFVYLRVGRTTS